MKAIYVNLPVKDLDKTRIFWTNLGFSFNEQFSNEQALCLEMKKDTIYAMLISHDHLKLLRINQSVIILPLKC